MSGNMSKEVHTKNFNVVIAIDFGTNYSGYAYSFSDDPHKIKLNKNWGQNRFNSYKTPSTIHMSNNGTFKHFGFDAIEEYVQHCDMIDDDSQRTSTLCSEIKMQLFYQMNQGLDISVKSNNGEIFLAVDIIGHSLKYLKSCALEEIEKQHTTKLDKNYIRWILTVPTMWKEQAKLFMREAAHRAGLIDTVNSEKLLIALEPEAASYCCRNLPVERFTGNEGRGLNMSPESQYMIIDAGGGTVDIVVHELDHDGTIMERNLASGGPFGGGFINKQFEILLQDIFGQEFTSKFKQKFPNYWLEVMLGFEEQKAKYGSGKMTLDKAFTFFLGQYKSYHNNAYSDPRQQGFDVKLIPEIGKIIIDNKHIRECYDKVIDKLITYIDSSINIEENYPDLKYIFLVGGFANSKYLYEKIKEKYSSICPVLIPPEPSTVVVKGAVMFGHNPQMIVTRVARYNYYYETCVTCDTKPENEKRISLTTPEGKYEVDTLIRIVKKNDTVTLSSSLCITVHPLRSNQVSVQVNIFSSDKDDVKDPYDSNATKIGYIEISSPDTTKGQNRDLKIIFILGDTEMKVKGKDVESGCTDETTVQFHLLQKSDGHSW